MNPEVFGTNLGVVFVLILKFFAFVILVLYLLFSFVVLRQVQMMTRVLSTKISRHLKVIALVHAAVAVIAFLIMLVAL
jgi:hypothetical protein